MPPQVIHGCDPNAWHQGLDGTTLNLLHKAILLKDTVTACFLIRNGADINSCTRPSESGRSMPTTPMVGGAGAGFASPLHMACERGLCEVVRCLVEHHAEVNAKVLHHLLIKSYQDTFQFHCIYEIRTSL